MTAIGLGMVAVAVIWLMLCEEEILDAEVAGKGYLWFEHICYCAVCLGTGLAGAGMLIKLWQVMP